MVKVVTSVKIDDIVLKKLKKKAIDKDKHISECFDEAILMWVKSG